MGKHVHATRSLALLVAVVMTAAIACSGSNTTTGSGSGSGGAGTTKPAYKTLRVPADHPTIQKAVDAAASGDLVLISPGVYKEDVVVEKAENITIRGTDRNKVILDGEFTRDNGIKIFKNGVAVENLTTRNYKGNGVFFTGDYDSSFTLSGYRASYVTAYNNGDYGIYAFNATNGVFDHDYGSGHPDSSYYIGQCNPCNAVITDVIGEYNMLGYSGTNSSDLFIVNSEFKNNMIGVVPNSQDGEKLAPESRTTIAGNWIHDNNNPGVPINNDQYRLASDVGIIITGGVDNVVTKNRIENNPRGGIGVILWPFRDPGLPPFEAIGNKVTDNVITGTGADGFGDLLLWVNDSTQGTQGNCFANNVYTRSYPADIEKVAPCTGPTGTNLPDIDLNTLKPGREGVDYKTMKAPSDQPNMPDAETAPPKPATPANLTLTIDLAKITLPAGNGGGGTGSSGTATGGTAAGGTGSTTKK